MSSRGTAGDVFDALCGQLAADKAVSAVSSAFARLSDDRGRVKYVYELLKQRGLLSRGKSSRCRKNEDESERLRRRAEADSMNENRLYATLQLFTKAVAHAHAGSENLGSAYLGRSGLLTKLGHFDNCQQDLQLAAKCSNANMMEIKSKRAECESARNSQSKPVEKKVIPQLTHPANKTIACAGDSVMIKKTVDCGRMVIATKDIQIGDVIAIETPFAAILVSDPDVATTHCHQCLKVIYGPLPCDHCSLAMYCSVECKLAGWKCHHQYECPITGALEELDLPSLTPYAIRVAVMAASEYNMIETYATDNELQEKPYLSARYEEIHNLCTNTEARSVADLFRRAVNAALIYDQFESNTAFFTTANDFDPRINRKVFQGILLRHMQTAPSNFHQISEKQLGNELAASSNVDIAGGAYSFLSLINHSCSPNVVRHCYGSTTVLRALKLIPRGAELLDNYGMHFAVMPKSERHEHLKSQYLFECKCLACVKNWPLYPDLKILENHPDVSYEEIMEVQDADSEGIVKLLDAFIRKARALQSVAPCKNLNGIEECIKECYSRLGNTRCID